MALAKGGKGDKLAAMKMKDGQLAGDGWNFKASLLVFERQVLVFPLLVVLLACISFLFGGRCAAWQWWTAVAIVVGTPFLYRGKWRAALGAAGLFALLLVVLKGMLPPLFWDNAECVDMQICHLPMAQLLIEGWNPVADPLAEGITTRLGLDLWGMAPLHVAFSPKTMAVLAAVAYKFVGDPTALTSPGLALLWLGVVLQAMRFFRGFARWPVIGALVWILPVVSFRMYVDLALAFASCGLLFAMANDLKRDHCDWLALTVWTIWMSTIKLNGMLAAFVFWSFFGVGKVWGSHPFRGLSWFRSTTCGIAVFALTGLLLWNPFVSSWRAYGHPLYPFSTIDEKKWPIQNLMWDLRLVNDDYRQMGKAGIWLHEYISPSFTTAYYKWKTGNADFSPERYWYPRNYFMQGKIRLALGLVFLVLFLLPRGRLFGVGGLLLSMLMPWDAIGYTRYTPWLSSLACLSVALGTEWITSNSGPNINQAIRYVGITACALAGFLWLWHHTRDVEYKAIELSTIRNQIHSRFFPAWRPNGLEQKEFTPLFSYLTMMDNHCHLLVKELGWHSTIFPSLGWRPYDELSRDKTTERPLWTLDQRQWFAITQDRDERMLADSGPAWCVGNIWDGISGCNEAEEVWVMTPWQYYLVSWNDKMEGIKEYYLGGERRAEEGRVAWLLRRTASWGKTWGKTYPLEIWKWLSGQKRLQHHV